MADFEDKLNSFNTVVSLPGVDQKGNAREFRLTARDKKKIKKASNQQKMIFKKKKKRIHKLTPNQIKNKGIA